MESENVFQLSIVILIIVVGPISFIIFSELRIKFHTNITHTHTQQTIMMIVKTPYQ